MTNHNTTILTAEILDRLAAADYIGLSTKDLSHKITSWARQQGDEFIKSVGSYNSQSGGYWEITGAQIGAILRKASKTNSNLVLAPIRKAGAALWQWQPTLDAHSAKQRRITEALRSIEVMDRSTWDNPQILVVRWYELPNALQPGTSARYWSVLAEFNISIADDVHVHPDHRQRLTIEEAKAGAEVFATSLRRTISKSVA